MTRQWKNWNIPEIPETEKDKTVECRTCGWTGSESDLVEVKNMGKNLAVITGERGCPKCKSLVVEYKEI